jgi:hypothetical protein
VKMQQTQPMQRGPVSGTRSQPLGSGTSSQVYVAPTTTDSSPAESDGMSMVFGVLAMVASLAAGWFAYAIYTASALKPWAQ